MANEKNVKGDIQLAYKRFIFIHLWHFDFAQLHYFSLLFFILFLSCMGFSLLFIARLLCNFWILQVICEVHILSLHGPALLHISTLSLQSVFQKCISLSSQELVKIQIFCIYILSFFFFFTGVKTKNPLNFHKLNLYACPVEEPIS